VGDALEAIVERLDPDRSLRFEYDDGAGDQTRGHVR
jgi:hypothetical protein